MGWNGMERIMEREGWARCVIDQLWAVKKMKIRIYNDIFRGFLMYDFWTFWRVIGRFQVFA